MPLPGPARLVQLPLAGGLSPADAPLLVRGDRHPVALVGAWAGGGALVSSDPARLAEPGEDPFALLDRQPVVEETAGVEGRPDPVGGGWFGYLGYELGARIERVPPPPPRPARLPPFALAFYDHLLRVDAAGRWWFEALWTDARDALLRERLALLRARLLAGARARPLWVGDFEPAPPGVAGHLAAVEACRERIAAGEVFQANLCLRLQTRWAGTPEDLFARAAGALRPRHAALVAGPWGSVCSLSPELFLRRRGLGVVTEPIKGTAPRGGHERAALAASAKDRAENVMIVDLMRNDLGRVCEYGSIATPALAEPREAPGVWHLVSTVTGRLRPEVGDRALLRATFPPGSVTGAPKIQSMRVIAELEATGREAYTGAVGYASPLAGLELNVAIRTLETSGERIWLGVGGGIVADSEPARELEECLVKARPIVAAVGARIAEGRQPAHRAAIRSGTSAAERLPCALAGAADRPDPARGVFETLLVRAGEAVDAGAHLARLERSVRDLYGQALPADLVARVRAAAAAAVLQRLRVLVEPGADGVAEARVAGEPLGREPEAAAVELRPVALPGGLGAHKWRDRRLLDSLQRAHAAVPLIVDLDGAVLEAAYASVWVVEGDVALTPPLDGRLLPGVVRERLLAAPPAGVETREERIPLERLAAADELLLSSSIRGVHPAALSGGEPRFVVGERLRAALLPQPSPAVSEPARAVTR